MGDYSRKTFNREKHYSGVQMQQGRVQLDADWNEQLDIHLYRTETEAVDVIGQSGVPKKNGGFKIGTTADGRDLTIAAGRIYVDGLLCELDKAATYTAQPYLPHPDFTAVLSPPASPPQSSVVSLKDGTYLVFLDAWQREITALDDKLLREVALGGPDTTTRLQNVWQVRLLSLESSPPSSPLGSPLSSPAGSPAGSPPNATVDCKSPFAQFDQLTAPTTGTLNARTQPPKPEENVCLLPPTAGYNRLENQLYRVEVHTGGALNQATFKWSRDNASVETKIKKISGNVVTVADLGKDEVLNFAGGQWVEIVDDEATLKSAPHPLAQIDKIGPGVNEITLKTSAAAFANLPGLKLRRWDQSGAAAKADGVNATLATWIELEGGIEVSFGAGNYHAGDYWLIPARTATGEIEWPPFEIPNNAPVPQPPRGIRHHFCRLALIRSLGGKVSLLADCRKPFPALTEICAEDICFDNDRCDFAGAETVQEALDRLCAARDLRFHNKHLHGWGIVCGLQVACGSDGTHVTVRPGYAIDCEGNDVILDRLQQVDLLDLLKQSPPNLPASPPAGLQDGEVCLVLESQAQANRRFRVEKFILPKSKFESLLTGTLLGDVLNDCIKSLIDFVKAEFTPQAGEENVPVGPTQKRLTAFGNLAVQLVNKQNGSFVFLSGEKGQEDRNLEDSILRNFYKKLREKLQSKTFCAMFENARPFPDYPYTGLDIATIFGKGFQKRLRIAPNGRIGYSVGATNKINVYDLEKGEMVDELEFPGGKGSIVQDVAFSADGRQLYAVATLNNIDSFFVVADVSGLKHTFRKAAMICDILVTSLATTSSSENVFAIGKGKGLYEVNPLNVEPKPTPRFPFNAVGHLLIADRAGMAFVTASSQTGPSDRYDTVRRLNLRTQENPVVFQVAAQDPAGAVVFTSGEDDIALSGEGDATRLYVVSILSSTTANKQVVVFNALDRSTTPQRLAFVDLGENTTIRLADNPETKHMMVTYEDSYRVGLINANNQLERTFRHPVQISPLSIAVSPERRRVYVLNYASNTLSSIPAERLQPKQQIPLQLLVDYRAGVLNAFADLLGGLLQYLKDCFCDHFLVNCPTCDKDDKLYLACITIKNGKVFKVCNFSLRKYVHSFPTVEYWLSVVPIIPIIKSAVETFCCAALPTFFSRFNAPKPSVSPDVVAVSPNRLTSQQFRTGVTFTQQADFQSVKAQALPKLSPGRQLVTNSITNGISRVFVPRSGAIASGDVVGQPVDQARTKLEAAKIVIDRVEPHDPKNAGRDLVRFTIAPTHLAEGTRVNLVTKDDKVLYYTLASEGPGSVQDLRDEVSATNAALTETKTRLDKTLPQIEGLKAQLETNKTELANTQPQILELRAKVDATATETRTAADANAALREQVTTLRAQLVEAQQKHDRELAASTAALGTQVTTLKTQLAEVQQKHDGEVTALRTALKTTTDDLQTQIRRIRPNT